MRAVVIWRARPLSINPGAAWGELSPLVGRPFLQHLVEVIVGQGIHDLEFILPENASLIADKLGSGTRWGARFRYYAVPAETSVYDELRRLPWKDPEETVMLAHSDRLPLFSLRDESRQKILYCWKEQRLRWTGWGLFRASDLTTVPKGLDEAGLMNFLIDPARDAACHLSGRPLTARTYDDLLESNRRVLAKEFTGLLIGGKEVQPGVWVARNVRVHPTATLSPPAYLGENCRIGALVQVGPSASIGRDCLIERETEVTDSVVYSGSYVGEQLTLRGVVVDHSRLVNTTCAAEIEEVDELLLGSVFGVPLRTRGRRIFSRGTAAIAFVVLLPCFIAVYLCSKLALLPALKKRAIVRTPAVSESYRWKTFDLWSFGNRELPAGPRGWLRHFLFSFIPALPSIVAGYMKFGGPRPQTKEELEQMPVSQRMMRLRLRPGILQPVLAPKPTTAAPGRGDGGLPETLQMMTAYAQRLIQSALDGVTALALRSKPE